MARRNDHTRDEIKVMAIAAGQKILKEQGFDKFSARKVAAEIGYTVGTLYNVFTDHNDLLLHINVVTLQDMQAYVLKQLPPDAAGAAAIKQLATAYISFTGAHEARWQALFDHRLPAGALLPGWYLAQTNALFAIVEQYVLPIVNHDQVSAVQAARVLWSSVHGICALNLQGKLTELQTGDLSVLINSLVENYLAGLKARLS